MREVVLKLGAIIIARNQVLVLKTLWAASMEHFCLGSTCLSHFCDYEFYYVLAGLLVLQ